ncbi:MAG: hypothetical protein H6623_00615 [Bdellovibrionaceae bacterium]|nr:hypothetical protein [Pseudobdellovibrionaceae bacterium]
MIKTFLFTLIGIVYSFACFAQQSAPAKSKRTTVNFEDQLIEGQATKPDLLYLLQKKKFNYKKLIRLRENFLPELRQTGNEITPTRKSKEK